MRKFWIVVLDAWFGAILGHALFHWILGLDEGWRIVGSLASAAIGGAFGMARAREELPLSAEDRRDTILGWGALFGAVATIACLFIPMPWGLLAATTVIAVTFVALRHVAGDAPG